MACGRRQFLVRKWRFQEYCQVDLIDLWHEPYGFDQRLTWKMKSKKLVRQTGLVRNATTELCKCICRLQLIPCDSAIISYYRFVTLRNMFQPFAIVAYRLLSPSAVCWKPVKVSVTRQQYLQLHFRLQRFIISSQRDLHDARVDSN